MHASASYHQGILQIGKRMKSHFGWWLAPHQLGIRAGTNSCLAHDQIDHHPAKDVKEALLGGSLVSLTLLFNFMFHTCSFSWIISWILLSLYIIIRFKREIYIITMITKTLQKKFQKKYFQLTWASKVWQKIKKGGGVKPNFTPSSPIFFKTQQKLHRNPRDLHCWSKFKLFSAYLSQLFLLSIHPTQVSAISIYFCFFFLVVFGALFVVSLQ